MSMPGVRKQTGRQVARAPDHSRKNGGSYLANTKSALKRVRSSEKKRMRNREVRSETRTYIKKARTQIESGQLDEAQKSVAQAMRAHGGQRRVTRFQLAHVPYAAAAERTGPGREPCEAASRAH